jgi:hypothetical protein
MKNKSKNHKHIEIENNQIADNDNTKDDLKDAGKLGGIIVFVGILLLSIDSFFINELENDYNRAQNRLFVAGFFIIIYNIIISIFYVNVFKEYKDLTILILKRKFDYKDSLNQLALANLSNLTLAIIVLAFIVDWSLYGGYKVKIGTTLTVLIIFTIIEIIKRGWKSKFKK